MMERSEIGHGSPDAYRELIYNSLAMAAIRAQLGTTYAEIGDDAGLHYVIRNLVGYARTAVGTFKDLKAMNQAEALE